jgi:hypothetical protein
MQGITFVSLESFAKFKLEKGEALCQEKMEQDHPAKAQEQVAVPVQVEAEWVAHLRRDRVVTAYV